MLSSRQIAANICQARANWSWSSSLSAALPSQSQVGTRQQMTVRASWRRITKSRGLGWLHSYPSSRPDERSHRFQREVNICAGITSLTLFITHLLTRWKMIYCFQEVYFKTTSRGQESHSGVQLRPGFQILACVDRCSLLGPNTLTVAHDRMFVWIINWWGFITPPSLSLIACGTWGRLRMDHRVCFGEDWWGFRIIFIIDSN